MKPEIRTEINASTTTRALQKVRCRRTYVLRPVSVTPWRESRDAPLQQQAVHETARSAEMRCTWSVNHADDPGQSSAAVVIVESDYNSRWGWGCRWGYSSGSLICSCSSGRTILTFWSNLVARRLHIAVIKHNLPYDIRINCWVFARLKAANVVRAYSGVVTATQ